MAFSFYSTFFSPECDFWSVFNSRKKPVTVRTLEVVVDLVRMRIEREARTEVVYQAEYVFMNTTEEQLSWCARVLRDIQAAANAERSGGEVSDSQPGIQLSRLIDLVCHLLSAVRRAFAYLRRRQRTSETLFTFFEEFFFLHGEGRPPRTRIPSLNLRGMLPVTA